MDGIQENQKLECVQNAIVLTGTEVKKRKHSRIREIAQCIVNQCQNIKYRGKYCNKHYLQLRRFGKILSRTKADANEIFEEEGYCRMKVYNLKGEVKTETIFDLEDKEQIEKYKWGLSKSGYICRLERGRRCNPRHSIYLHKFILNSKSKQVDHINQNKLDNRKINLRPCTNQQNNWNKKLTSRKSKTKYKNIMLTKQDTFMVSIKLNGEPHYFGTHKTLEKAIKARNIGLCSLFGDFAPEEAKVIK